MIEAVGQLPAKSGREFMKMWKTIVEPGSRLLQDHRHGNFEIAMVAEGGGLYYTVGGVVPIEKGDMFVFPSNEPHWIWKVNPGGLEMINLHFNDALFHSGCSIAEVYPNLFFAHSDSFSSRIAASRGERTRAFFERIRAELQNEQPESAACIFSCLDLLFACLMREHGYYMPQEGTHRAMERIREGLRYIDTHFVEDITLEQIAEASGLSPNYFTSLFRECFRCRLWDHVLSKRIDHAKILLRSEEEQTVMQIALRCGFHNTANFNRIFRRFTGLTPSQFRKGVYMH